MILSDRAKLVKESVTLKLNEKVVELVGKGRRVYNLTAGQLPFKPHAAFCEGLTSETNFLKSFQYSPVPGYGELRKKLIDSIEKSRNISFSEADVDVDCVISNGAKHTIYNILGALVNPGDEVVLLSPYWISYPEMVALWGGISKIVPGKHHNAYVPTIDDVKKAITDKTKVIILNSPNNPSGVHYPEKWMREFASIMEAHPNLIVLSDEIYFDLSYYDPKPSYFYQYNTKLLKRTVIVDGISKSLAATGLRIGYCFAPKGLAKAIENMQAQTTSGASSLVQRALLAFPNDKIEEFLLPIKSHLRDNSKQIKKTFDDHNLGNLWYQSVSAFYFLIDFSKSPIFSSYQKNSHDDHDYSAQICEDLLEEQNVAMVPGGDFGVPNCGRLSLVLEQNHFGEAMELIAKFLTNPKH